VAQIEAAFAACVVELWAFDEHRIGLLPIVRKVWAKRGSRPVRIVETRYQWLYLYGFVHPQSGRTHSLLLPRMKATLYNQALKEFAQAVGAGPHKQIVLVVDGAGSHRSHEVVVPEGVHLLPLPPYSPELQPAEKLWPLTNEPLVNKRFETLADLEAVQAARCKTLATMTEEVRGRTLFHWWPRITK
jgi:transposase